MARRIEYVPLADLVPAGTNPKAHADDLIDESLAEFGFIESIVVDERTGVLVAGHGRRERLLALAASGVVPPEGVTVDDAGGWLVPVTRGWASRDDRHAAKAVVALNRVGEKGGWDDSKLADVLETLAGGVEGLERQQALIGSGFSVAEYDAVMASARVEPERFADPDDVPDPGPEAVTRPGDLWVLGDHRLLCGDATVAGDYDRVLDGEDLAGAVVSDPPYGVGIGAKNRALDAIDRAGRVLTDLEGDQGIEEVEALWRASFGVLAAVMAPGTPYYINGPQGGDLGLLLLLRDAGLAPRHILIWVKNRPSFSIGRLDYDYQHEPIVYGWKPGGAHPWHADSPRTSVFHVDRPQASPDHPTAKPVALLVPLIENSTTVGQHVLDPFGGSGSTLIAAEQTGRHSRVIEIAPRYCDVICRRWQQFTGGKPERDGEPVDFLAGPQCGRVTGSFPAPKEDQ